MRCWRGWRRCLSSEGLLRMDKDDEGWASKLLENWFQQHTVSGAIITRALKDPPDLTVCFGNGEVWGVEVTRVYRPIPKIGTNDVVESPSVSSSLEKFGRELDEETAGTRQQNYSLFLRETDGIGARVRRPLGQSFNQWKSATRASIIAHVECNSDKVLEGAGFTLRPCGDGDRWSVMTQGGSHELDSALHQAVSTAFDKKARDLPNWRIQCQRKSLLLLNCYVLADDETALTQLRGLLDSQSGNGFDSVYWSGSERRNLREITPTTNVNPATVR